MEINEELIRSIFVDKPEVEQLEQVLDIFWEEYERAYWRTASIDEHHAAHVQIKSILKNLKKKETNG